MIDGALVSEDEALTNTVNKLTISEAMHSSQLLWFERESERLTSQINAKETENDLLREQIENVKEKINKSKKDYNEAIEVGAFLTRHIICVLNHHMTCIFYWFIILTDTLKLRSKDIDQKDKMLQLMKRRRLANKAQSQEKEIAELRSQLKKLRCRTFPQF